MQSISIIKYLLAAAVGLFWSAVTALTVTVIPAAPRYLEPVYARLTPETFSGENIYGGQASMNGTNITVEYQALPEIGQYYYDVELGRFPAGTYTVQVQSRSGPVYAQFTVTPAMRSTLPAPSHPGNVPAVNYSDIWWTPSESGWGLSVSHGPTNILFAVWFVYDASGNPVWYTLQPGQWDTANIFTTYRGPIYKTSGPYFGAAFNPAQVGIVQVGTGALSFRDSNSGTFSYVVEGVTGSKNITRQAIE